MGSCLAPAVLIVVAALLSLAKANDKVVMWDATFPSKQAITKIEVTWQAPTAATPVRISFESNGRRDKIVVDKPGAAAQKWIVGEFTDGHVDDDHTLTFSVEADNVDDVEISSVRVYGSDGGEVDAAFQYQLMMKRDGRGNPLLY